MRVLLKVSLVLTLAGLAGAGCGEVESCAQGTPGCLDGYPDEDGCKFGLVIGADGWCTDPKRGGGSESPCGCAPGQFCDEQGTCIDLCADPLSAPEPVPTPRACRQPDGTAYARFSEAAVAACSQECVRRGALCGTPCDPETECTSSAAMALSALACPTQDVACAVQLCETARDRPCSQQSCANGVAPRCTGVRCSNTCSIEGVSYVNDGVCDDGDLRNGISSLCEWGTDCGDCGPRTPDAEAPPTRVALGGFCADALQCGADLEDFTESRGWCVGLGELSPICMPNCTEDETCPEGFVCETLRNDPDGPGGVAGEDYEDDFGNVARFCRRAMCPTRG